MAKIDVLLPVKDGMAFLAESIDSIQAQTCRDWRLLVLDHGSTDGSAELASAYQARDPRIEVHRLPHADSLSGLLNAGLDLCDCAYVMRHDADDICYPQRMVVSLAAFESAPECIAVGGQADMIDGAGNAIGSMRMPVGADRLAAASLFRNPVAHPTAMLKFSEVQARGIRYGVDFLHAVPPAHSLEVRSLAEDYLLFGQIAILGKCLNVPDTLIRYRSHGANVSSLRSREQKEVALKITRFLARSLCSLRNLPHFDPAPFSNISGSLFDMEPGGDYGPQFRQMRATLEQGLGRSAGLDREMRFRYVVSTRADARMLLRYGAFALRNTPETGEWNTVRSWLTRRLPGRALHAAAPA